MIKVDRGYVNPFQIVSIEEISNPRDAVMPLGVNITLSNNTSWHVRKITAAALEEVIDAEMREIIRGKK